jgi:hypothetical protein
MVMNVKLVPYFGYFSLTPLSQTRTKLYILAPYKDIKLDQESIIDCKIFFISYITQISILFLYTDNS